MQAFVQNHPAARGGGTSENPTLLPTVHGEGTAPRSRRHWAPPRAEAGGWPGGGQQRQGTTEQEKAGWAGSWTPISGGCRGHGGLSCSGGGRSVRVRARADQELRDRWRGGGCQPLPPGASWWRAAQSSLAVSPRREEVEPEGSQHGPLSCPRQKLPRWTPRPAAGGLGPCQAWPLAESALARWGAKPLGWGWVGQRTGSYWGL